MLLQQEETHLKNTISGLNLILKSDDALSNVIIDELKATDKAIGIPRRSVIEADIESIKIAEKDLITDEQVMIGLTRDGYIKRSSVKSYQMSQQVSLKSEDVMMYERPHQTLETLIMFTNLGNFIYLPIYKLEDQKWKDLGVYIHNIVPLEPNEIIIEIMAFHNFKLNQTIILLTALGQIKQVKLEDFEMVRYHKTTKAIALDPEDALVRVVIAEGDYVSIMTEGGYMLNIHRHDIPYYGLNARGVKSIHLFEDDIATALTTFNIDDDIHVVSSRGHLITIEDTPISKRGRKGFLAIEPLKSLPHIPFVMKATSQISEDMHIYMYTSQNIHIKKIHELISKHNKYGKFILDSKTEFIQYVHFDFFKEDHYQPLIIDESLKKPKLIKNLDDSIEHTLDHTQKSVINDTSHDTLEKPLGVSQESNPLDLLKQEDNQVIQVIEEKANDDISSVKQTKTKQKSESLPKKQTIILNRLDLFDDEE
jgi:topoisomerase-4 subunit A